jgi:hypothetical protein
MSSSWKIADSSSNTGIEIDENIDIFTKKRKYNICDVIFTPENMKDLLDILATFIVQEFNSLTTLYSVAELRMVCCKVK